MNNEGTVPFGPCISDRRETDSDFTSSFNKILLSHLQLPPDVNEVPEGCDLMKLGLDSISAVALLLDLEEAFGITFPQSMISMDLYKCSVALRRAVLAQIESREFGQPSTK